MGHEAKQRARGSSRKRSAVMWAGTQGERSSDQGQGTRNGEMALEFLDREEVKQGGIVETRWQKSTAPFNLTLF